MASYEELEVTAALRRHARLQLDELDETLRELARPMDLDERMELSIPLLELKKLLAGDEAPPASIEVPANVRRLVVAGRSGPAFGERSGIDAVIGKGGLRSGALDLPADTGRE